MNYKGKIVIGLVGGIGVGKTRVLQLLSNHYNAMIIEADKIGHLLQQPGQDTYDRILEFFGEEILESSQHINRKKLGAIVFSDKHKLEILNSIMHPAIHEYIEKLIIESDKCLIFLEAAILTETSLVNLTDALWYIYSDMDTRLKRLQTYREISKEKAMRIMANQPNDEYFRKKCEVVIDNSFTEENTLNQINNEITKIQEEQYE